MATMNAQGLPVETILPQLERALSAHGAAVLEAPPGAGKTTLVPLALLNAAWLAQTKIVMLEPRRVAARAAAWRMAELLDEPVGQTVGYAMRFERNLGPKTRIEVLTEGLFTRRLQQDPELADVGLVIFDEFHERSLDADLALTLCLDARASLRPDLRLLVMSATLPGNELAALLDNAPVVRSEGRSFPVRTFYRPNLRDIFPMAHVAAVVREALEQADGAILVFLPGVGEIRRLAGMLGPLPGVDILELHGSLDRERQLQAIAIGPAERRKIVLATNIAETSLTIEGVATVVDSGLERRVRYSPRTGMSRLVTGPISRASADQRRGRAGRTAPGICYRLWPEPEDRARVPFHPPEIMEADLAPLLLELMAWGVSDARSLNWPTPPPEGALAEARATLGRLGLLDAQGDLTDRGRRASVLPVHPRLAAMVLARPDATSLILAALLSGRDPWRDRLGSDLAARVEAYAREKPRDFSRIVRQLARAVNVKEFQPSLGTAGEALAFAFPDRLARRRGGDRQRYQLANGRGAVLAAGDVLAGADWLVIAELDDSGTDARIRLAATITGDAVLEIFADQIETQAITAWNDRTDRVEAVTRTSIGSLILRESDLETADPFAVHQALLDGLRKRGVDALPWTEAARQLRARVELARTVDKQLPEWDDDHIMGLIGPLLEGLRSLAELETIDLAEWLRSTLPFAVRRRLDSLTPAELTTPAGTRAVIDYLQDPPVLAAKLQAFFGWRTTPTILEGRLPLAIQLLSPAGRPLQVTQDLEGFWRNGYLEVRKEMRGRYPKHPWPEDPLAADATVRAKGRGG
ncbi:MAG: ATP-dependent helicase HrpB [Pseudomonadota bacterium]